MFLTNLIAKENNMETATGSSEHPRTGRGSAAKPTLLELAHAALEETDSNETAATIVLRDQVLEDIAYVDEICALIVHRVAMDSKDKSSNTSRRRSTSTVHTTGTAADPDSVTALASVIGRSLLNFRLPNGMPVLKHATADDIDAAIVKYRKTAHTMTTRVKWLEAIKTRLQPGQKVGEAIDELTARKLYEDADAK
jgi:hypothetical protein